MRRRFTRVGLASWVVALALSGSVAAQGNPAMAGDWVLDESKSQVGRGRAGGPGPSQLILKMSPTDVTVVSDTGTNRARETTVYKLDGKEHEVPGPQSWDTVAKAAWEGDRLLVTIARIIESPNGPVRIEMRDVYSVNGDVLTIERTQGRSTWTSVFTRRP